MVGEREGRCEGGRGGGGGWVEGREGREVEGGGWKEVDGGGWKGDGWCRWEGRVVSYTQLGSSKAEYKCTLRTCILQTSL